MRVPTQVIQLQMESWKKKLREIEARPAVLLAVREDGSEGRLAVLSSQPLSPNEVLLLLLSAARDLEQQTENERTLTT